MFKSFDIGLCREDLKALSVEYKVSIGKSSPEAYYYSEDNLIGIPIDSKISVSIVVISRFSNSLKF